MPIWAPRLVLLFNHVTIAHKIALTFLGMKPLQIILHQTARKIYYQPKFHQKFSERKCQLMSTKKSNNQKKWKANNKEIIQLLLQRNSICRSFISTRIESTPVTHIRKSRRASKFSAIRWISSPRKAVNPMGNSKIKLQVQTKRPKF